jgi:hypothetical protein
MEVWGFGVRSLSIRLCLESGYGSMLWRNRLFSDRLWIQNYGSLAGRWCSKVVTWPYGESMEIY